MLVVVMGQACPAAVSSILCVYRDLVLPGVEYKPFEDSDSGRTLYAYQRQSTHTQTPIQRTARPIIGG